MIGHIINVGVRPDPSNALFYGLWIEARRADEPRGYGIPRGDGLFYRFDDARLLNIFNAVTKPAFERHDDLLGVEVEMTMSDDNLVELHVTGGKKIYLESDIGRAGRQRREGLAKPGDDGRRSRRYYGCRAADDMRSVIENLEVSDQHKTELTNLTNCLLRMVMIHNDGQISTQHLRAF